MDIPIIIVCYNNYQYVNNTLKQILKINKEYYRNIQILNNKSTCLNTINFLNNVDVKVIHNSGNNGPWITPYNNKDVYDSLPNKFILTDPDLQLNENIPSNFIEILSVLSDKYETGKIGFALNISDFEQFYKDNNYFNNLSIYDWEKRFWQNKIHDDNYELYNAIIDTTFCLIDKNNTFKHVCEIRIAGDFTAKHLPWYTENDIYSVYEKYINSISTERSISTISKIISSHTENKYLKIYKNGELFLIENNESNPNLSFWRNNYSGWENEAFKVFDKYLSKDKIFVDIGGWIGTTAMYGARKSKHVYSIEANNHSLNDMMVNLTTNCTNNFTLINKAIFNVDNIKINFGKNIFLQNSKINDSTSQIYSHDIFTNEYYLVETITIDNIIEKYKINVYEISLIKVDIEGGEENILNELFDIHVKYSVPLYISFHYSWWKDKNLDRFSFLPSNVKNIIISNPFTSIIFSI
jgi:FkbM family methyltransferase